MTNTKPTQNNETQPTVEITPKEAMETILPDGGLTYVRETDRFMFNTDSRTARLIAMRLHIAFLNISEPENACMDDAWVQIFNEDSIDDIRLDGGQFSFNDGVPKYSWESHPIIFLRHADERHLEIEGYKIKLEKILNITFDDKGVSHPIAPPTSTIPPQTPPPTL